MQFTPIKGEEGQRHQLRSFAWLLNIICGIELPGGPGKWRRESGPQFRERRKYTCSLRAIRFPIKWFVFIHIFLLKYNLKHIFLKKGMLPIILPLSLLSRQQQIYKVAIMACLQLCIFCLYLISYHKHFCFYIISLLISFNSYLIFHLTYHYLFDHYLWLTNIYK